MNSIEGNESKKVEGNGKNNDPISTDSNHSSVNQGSELLRITGTDNKDRLESSTPLKSHNDIIVIGIAFPKRDTLLVTKMGTKVRSFVEDIVGLKPDDKSVNDMLKRLQYIQDDNVNLLHIDKTPFLFFYSSEDVIKNKFTTMDALVNSSSELDEISYFRTLGPELSRTFDGSSYTNAFMNVRFPVKNGKTMIAFVAIKYAPLQWSKTDKIMDIEHDSAQITEYLDTVGSVAVNNAVTGTSKPVISIKIDEMVSQIDQLSFHLVNEAINYLRRLSTGNVSTIVDMSSKFLSLSDYITAKRNLEPGHVLRIKTNFTEVDPRLLIKDTAISMNKSDLNFILCPSAFKFSNSVGNFKIIDSNTFINFSELIKGKMENTEKNIDWGDFVDSRDTIIRDKMSTLSSPDIQDTIYILHSDKAIPNRLLTPKVIIKMHPEDLQSLTISNDFNDKKLNSYENDVLTSDYQVKMSLINVFLKNYLAGSIIDPEPIRDRVVKYGVDGVGDAVNHKGSQKFRRKKK